MFFSCFYLSIPCRLLSATLSISFQLTFTALVLLKHDYSELFLFRRKYSSTVPVFLKKHPEKLQPVCFKRTKNGDQRYEIVFFSIGMYIAVYGLRNAELTTVLADVIQIAAEQGLFAATLDIRYD